jgi:hypothetical protein
LIVRLVKEVSQSVHPFSKGPRIERVIDGQRTDACAVMTLAISRVIVALPGATPLPNCGPLNPGLFRAT